MNEKNAVTILSDALLSMTNRAIEAESQAATEKRRADEWYQYFQTKESAANELSDKLTAEIQEHQQTKQRLAEALRGKETPHHER